MTDVSKETPSGNKKFWFNQASHWFKYFDYVRADPLEWPGHFSASLNDQLKEYYISSDTDEGMSRIRSALQKLGIPFEER